MIKSITNFLIFFFIFQQLKSQISQIVKLTKMELTRFAMKLFIRSSFAFYWIHIIFLNVSHMFFHDSFSSPLISISWNMSVIQLWILIHCGLISVALTFWFLFSITKSHLKVECGSARVTDGHFKLWRPVKKIIDQMWRIAFWFIVKSITKCPEN